GALLCRAARRLGADRDRLRLAGHRLLHHQFAADHRHERRARRHPRRRRHLHRPQPRGRSALSPRRSEAAVKTASGRLAMWQDWLQAEAPSSRRQARLGEAYRGGLAFLGHPSALAGLLIIVALTLLALLAPVIAGYRPEAADI